MTQRRPVIGQVIEVTSKRYCVPRFVKSKISGFIAFSLFLLQKAKAGEMERRADKRKIKKSGGGWGWGVRNKGKKEKKGKFLQERGNKEKKLSGSSNSLLRLSANLCHTLPLPGLTQSIH